MGILFIMMQHLVGDNNRRTLLKKQIISSCSYSWAISSFCVLKLKAMYTVKYSVGRHDTMQHINVSVYN